MAEGVIKCHILCDKAKISKILEGMRHYFLIFNMFIFNNLNIDIS